MKEIQPLDIWKNGYVKTGTKLNIEGNRVILFNSASFIWEIQTDNGEVISSGSIGISGEQYTAWGSDDNYIYILVASDLNLTLVSE